MQPMEHLTLHADILAGLAALAEPNATALLLVVFGLLVAFSVLFSRTIDRLGIPIVLLFIVLGMLGGSEGLGGLPFENYGLAVRLGTIALVLILFDGGLNTSVNSIRSVAAPASILATVGVALTAGFLTLGARLFGLTWTESMLLGAVVSSTDAAAVFAVLRGGRLQLKERVGRTIEVESCVNDPMAVILTLTLVQAFSAGSAPWTNVLVAVPVQLGVGVAVGAMCGWLGRFLLLRVRVPTVGLYPVLTLALSFLSFGAATLAYGSGFLAVFVTGVVLGSANLPYRNGLARVHDALAWLSQVSMFLMMGLLVFPSQLTPVAGTGLLLALMLAFVARPLAVVLCLLPFRLPAREVIYVAWIGLRGAVPIVLATFPVLAQVPGAMTVFNLVFFIVVASTLIPGATIRPVTRWLRLNTPERPLPSTVLEINSTFSLNGELVSFLIDPSVAVCGAYLREIEFPPGAAVVLVVRGKDLIAPRGNTRIEPQDHVYVFFKSKDRPTLELLFGSPELG
jgi:potassium/hydrogen antiporter